ncbi:MAG: hypothetical protein K0Q51_498 [Rickettsiaceae bacterium]|jgi:hypothetical protein|nr:hypothetical protein [Rickettsiaceae bacterium]
MDNTETNNIENNNTVQATFQPRASDILDRDIITINGVNFYTVRVAPPIPLQNVGETLDITFD